MEAKTSNLDDYLNKMYLSKAFIYGGEPALRLFAKLLNCEPCPDCDFIKKYCRCKGKK